MPLEKKGRIYLLVGVIVLLVWAAFSAGKNYNPSSVSEPVKSKRGQSNYTYISPLLDCALSEPDSATTKKLERDLRALIDKKIQEKKVQDVAIYFHDLTGNSWIGINKSQKFSPASLLKVPIMIAYFKQAENNPEKLKEELVVEDVLNPGATANIIPQKSVIPGEKYTVEELIRYAIHYSDNLAANTLLQAMPEEELEKIYLDIGISPPDPKIGENFMNIMDYASFFEILYNASYLSKDMSEKALAILTESTFSLGLSSGVPIKVKIAHKFGERIFENQKQLHDCGIIYRQNNPYLLCIMTRSPITQDNNFQEMAEIIKDISLKVYSPFNN